MEQEFKHSIDQALHNANLTGALGKFSEAWRANRAKIYEGIDFEELRGRIAERQRADIVGVGKGRFFA